LEYLVRGDDPQVYPAYFAKALAWQLAFDIAPSLTGGDPFNLQARAKREAMETLGMAKMIAANEEQPDEEPDSDFELERAF